jgi:hypothetical protein
MRLTSLITAGVAVAAINGLSFIEARDAVIDYTSSSIEALKRSLPELPKREASLTPRKDNCPAIWTSIVKDLNAMFLGSDGQCNDDARAAIRVSPTSTCRSIFSHTAVLAHCSARNIFTNKRCS